MVVVVVVEERGGWWGSLHTKAQSHTFTRHSSPRTMCEIVPFTNTTTLLQTRLAKKVMGENDERNGGSVGVVVPPAETLAPQKLYGMYTHTHIHTHTPHTRTRTRTHTHSVVVTRLKTNTIRFFLCGMCLFFERGTED